MKLSVSLPDDDVAILDEYARAHGLRSRSAAVHAAVVALRIPELEQDYAAAWDEWVTSGDEIAWQSTTSDGF